MSAVNGIQTGEGVLDTLGGIMVLAAIFWPGATYLVQAPSSQFLLKSKATWPSAQHILRHILNDYGYPPPWSPDDGLDGLVTRHWSFPFPASWAAARDYSGEFLRLGVGPLASSRRLTRA